MKKWSPIFGQWNIQILDIRLPQHDLECQKRGIKGTLMKLFLLFTAVSMSPSSQSEWESSKCNIRAEGLS